MRSLDGEVRWVTWDGAAWSGWKTVPGGRRLRAAAAVADTSQRMWLFARRGAEVVYNVYDAGKGPENGWNGWRLAAPAAAPPPPPPPPPCDLAAGRVTGHAKLVRFGGRPRLTGRARRTDGAPLVSAAVIVSPRRGRLDADRDRRPGRPLLDATAGRPDPQAEPAGVGARRLDARLREHEGPHPRRRDAEGQQARAPRRHRALPRPPEGPAGARPRQARGAAGARRRQVAHVRAAALAP